MEEASQPACPAAPRLGVDLGGTKVEVAVLGGDGGILLRRRVPTPRGDYAGTLDAIEALVRDAERGVGARCTVGVGIPGTVSARDGRVMNANSTWLNGRPLGRDLEGRLGREVRLANDANCLAVSEASDGAAAGRGVVFAAILGTGTGAGLAIGGRAHAGAHGIAGEWGHVPLPAPRDDERPGPACWCGRRGCLETWLSGPGLAADHARATGESADAAAIAARAAAGDAGCAASLDRWLDRLARGLAMVVNLVDPDAIVLGGGLSNVGRVADELPARIAPHVFADVPFVTPVLRAAHGDSSGVRGAAWLWGGRGAGAARPSAPGAVGPPRGRDR